MIKKCYKCDRIFTFSSLFTMLEKPDDFIEPSEIAQLAVYSKQRTPHECGYLTAVRIGELLDDVKEVLERDDLEGMLFLKEKLSLDLHHLMVSFPLEASNDPTITNELIFLCGELFLARSALATTYYYSLNINFETKKKFLITSLKHAVANMEQVKERLEKLFEKERYH